MSGELQLARASEELRLAPLASPHAPELAVAILCDVFRLGSVVPPGSAQLGELRRAGPRVAEQLEVLAHLLRVTHVREVSIERARNSGDPKVMLHRFFEEIAPLTAEMIRGNAFRQEEFLRKWAHAIGAPIAGEHPKDSKARREALDYRKAAAEYARAEAARKKESEKREAALREAERRAAEARGWRE